MNTTSLLKSYLENKFRVLLVGPPGCGKTARNNAIADLVNYKCFTFRSSLCERVDINGCLVPDLKNKITETLPLGFLKHLKTTKENTLLFLDDLGQAPIDVQAALMKLFDPGELPDNVVIWGATNRPGDKAGVTALCEPLRSRFHLAFNIPVPGMEEKADGSTFLENWKKELENWIRWAINFGAPPEVIAWHRSNMGSTLYMWKPHSDPAMRFPDYRSWETVIKLLKAGISDTASISATIGKPTTEGFFTFCRIKSQLPFPLEKIWKNPHDAIVPQDPSACYLLASCLALAVEPKYVQSFITYIDRLPRVYGALAARDALNKDKKKEIARTPAWQKWYAENSDLFLG